MRVVVTGGSGRLGAEIIRQLTEDGHEAINLDIAPPKEQTGQFLQIDLTDYGQVIEALTSIEGAWDGVEAVIHLAAIVGASKAGGARMFAHNAVGTFNVFWAARAAKIKNVVWASSETLTGIPFDQTPPYLPIDEDTPRQPNSTYALAKLVDEVVATELCRWDPELKMVAMRYSWIKSPEDYAEFPSYETDPTRQLWNLWSYIDVRDAARATLLALYRQSRGFEAYLIASPDTLMGRATADLVSEYLQGVEIRSPIEGHGSLLSTRKAQEVLGWKPKFSWRDR